MPSNALYKFIEKEYNEGNFEDSEIQIKLLERAIQQGEMPERYGMIDLKSVNFSFTHDAHYKLQEDHISVYEMIDPKNLHLSKYHYTAKFKNNKHVNYQLHVYFNEKDQPVLVEFAMENPDGSYTKVKIKSDLQSLFIELATDRVRVTMGQLQEKHRHYIQSLVSEYEALDLKLNQMKPDGDEYEFLLNSMLEKLQALSLYHTNLIYKKQGKLLQKILQDDLSGLKKENKSGFVKESKSKEANFQEKDSKQEIIEEKNITKKIVKKLQENKEDLSTYLPQLRMLRNAMEDATASLKKGDDLFDYFFKYLQYCDMLELLVEEDGFYADNATLKEIRYHYTYAHLNAKHLIQRSLAVGSYDLIEKLNEDLSDTAEMWIIGALISGDYKVLEFLLHRSSIAINSLLVYENYNPVLYCYLHHSRQQPKLNCLMVLLKHGASIFVKLEDGFSVANHILRDPTHPLLPALEYQSLTQVEFCKVLLKEIDGQMDRVTDDAVKKKLTLLKNNLTMNLVKIKSISNKEAVKYMREHVYLPQYENKQVVDAVDAFLLEPGTQQAINKYKKCHEEYLKSLSLVQRAKEVVDNIDELNFLMAMLKRIHAGFSDAFKDKFNNILKCYTCIAENKTEINGYKKQMVSVSWRKKEHLRKEIQELEGRNNKLNEVVRNELARFVIEGDPFKYSNLSFCVVDDNSSQKQAEVVKGKSALQANSLLAHANSTKANSNMGLLLGPRRPRSPTSN